MKRLIIIKMVFSIFLIFKTLNVFSQNACQPITQDLKEIIGLAFETELKENDSIILRYNFKAVCLEKAINNSKIKIWSESKLYRRRYLNFYSIEDVDYDTNFAKVTYIQRNNNLMFYFLFYKDSDGWHIINKKTKQQGRIKGDDFLILSIKKALRKRK